MEEIWIKIKTSIARKVWNGIVSKQGKFDPIVKRYLKYTFSIEDTIQITDSNRLIRRSFSRNGEC